MALTGIQIFKLLPKTNCKECGVPTCLAFAMNLASGKAELDNCPYVSDEAREKLSEASAPPIRPVAIGKGVIIEEETSIGPYVSIGEGGEGILEEASAIGKEHAENALALGLPVSDALRVSMFFRDAVLEAALDLPEKAHVHTGANLNLVRRINTLLNVVQLAITERYDQEMER